MLDPEQNGTFNDHYLEVDYDLSNVMFVTTANTLNIPPALLDRMEVIRIAGYTEDERWRSRASTSFPMRCRSMASSPRNGPLMTRPCSRWSAAITREAGVRNLEREISNLARKAVKELVLSKKSL